MYGYFFMVEQDSDLRNSILLRLISTSSNGIQGPKQDIFAYQKHPLHTAIRSPNCNLSEGSFQEPPVFASSANSATSSISFNDLIHGGEMRLSWASFTRSIGSDASSTAAHLSDRSVVD